LGTAKKIKMCDIDLQVRSIRVKYRSIRIFPEVSSPNLEVSFFFPDPEFEN